MIEKFSDGQEDRYYPLELCKMVDESKTKWFTNTFMENGQHHQKEDDNDDGESISEMQGRNECSQGPTYYSLW